jgi:antitoxin (DNA-binding transcriptional repressor) of toxin-antitoxin stability system
MPSITIEDAQTRLPQIIERLLPGESVVITREDKPVARLMAEAPPRKPRKAGNCKGMIAIVSDDDSHLKDFAEYM